MGEKYIKWDFTGKCNLRCRHCSVGKQYFSGQVNEISLEEKLSVVENVAAGGIKGISFLGGEPLVLDEDFFAVARQAALRGIETTLVTNGMLLGERTWGRLLDSGIDQVVVSLDGATDQTHGFVRGNNTFATVTGNLRGFAEYAASHDQEVRIKVNTVLNKRNLPEMTAMLDLCRSMQVDEWSLLSLGGVGYAEDHIDELGLSPLEEIEAARMLAQAVQSLGADAAPALSPQFAYPLVWDCIEKQSGLTMPRTRVCCNAAISLGFIGPDGMLYPCDRIANKEYIGARIGGAEIRPMSLLDTSFYEIWNSDYFVNMFEFILDPNTYRGYDPCNRCRYLKDRSCNPCPLYSLNSKVVINTCKIAEKVVGDISGTEQPSYYLNSKTGRSRGAADVIGPCIGNEIPVKEEGVRFYAEADFGVLMNPYTVDFMGVNRIGQEIWHMIDGHNSVDAIVSHLEQVALEVRNRVAADATGTDLGNLLRSNIRMFLSDLTDAGVITFRDGG